MNNIHGARINMDIPVRAGSGFVGKHGADFINFNDSWSQIINLISDQDGSVYMIDWYDKNQCHNNDPEIHDRSNGRIFKVTYGATKTTKVDLAKLGNEELAKLQTSGNNWYARHARRILQERGSTPAIIAELGKIIDHDPNPVHQLRALWTEHATSSLTEATALKALSNPDEYVRAWAVQLLCEENQPSAAALAEFGRLAKSDPSPVVRLYLASAMQRTPVAQRGEVVEALLAHAEDDGRPQPAADVLVRSRTFGGVQHDQSSRPARQDQNPGDPRIHHPTHDRWESGAEIGRNRWAFGFQPGGSLKMGF